MTDETRRVARMLIGILCAGGITAGAILQTSLANDGAISTNSGLSALIAGVVVMMQNCVAALSQPPSSAAQAQPPASPQKTG